VKEYWDGILGKHLDYGSGIELVVPKYLAMSIRRYGDWSGTTFDEGSILRPLEQRLEASGTHSRKRTSISAEWENIQSITFSYKDCSRRRTTIASLASSVGSSSFE
jgi:hypothetical protein